LNQHWFADLEEAREEIETWRQDYNQQRPHSALGYQTPKEFAAEIAARRASPPRPAPSLQETSRFPRNSHYDWTTKRGQVRLDSWVHSQHCLRTHLLVSRLTA
jgi:hypothetical protein